MKPDDYFDVDWRKGVDGPSGKLIMMSIPTRLFGGDMGAGSNVMRNAPRHESGGVVLTFDSGRLLRLPFLMPHQRHGV